jgi:hypothetical protein
MRLYSRNKVQFYPTKKCITLLQEVNTTPSLPFNLYLCMAILFLEYLNFFLIFYNCNQVQISILGIYEHYVLSRLSKAVSSIHLLIARACGIVSFFFTGS